MNCKRIYFTLLLSTIGFYIQAQTEFGGHITGQQWQVISSPSANIIFPKGIEPQAQRVANVVNFIDLNNRRSIGDKKGRINIVLQTQTVNPNGYVGLAPFRSEFFCTPPASNLLLGNQDWLDGLSVHEYRHVLQTLNSRRGITKLGSILQGQGLWALLSNLSIPNWYSEGDAVIAETALSKGGRGRASFFTLEQRALANVGVNYSYQKNRNGSYRSLVPDHYRLGYLMLTQARQLKGNDITAKIQAEAARYKGIVYPFSRALKRNLGYNSTNLYKLSWKENKQAWQERLDATTLIPTQAITKKTKRTVTDYRYPRVWKNDVLIARKSSYQQTDQLVQLENGKEKVLTTIGYNNDDFFSLNGNIVAWAELSRNPRRGYQDFTNIYLFDLQSQQKRQLTHKTRYFSPIASPDGRKIAAIYVSPMLKNEIHVLDAVSGKLLENITTPDNYFFSRLAWTENGDALVSIAKHQSQLALTKINVKEKGIIFLTSWTHHTIEAPVVFNDKVYFNASFSTIDNIYCTDLAGSKKISKVTSVPVAAFEPEVSKDGKTLYFTEFTNMGYVISKQPLEVNNSSEFVVKEPFELPIFKASNFPEEGGSIFEKLPTQSYGVKSYRGLFKGLKLHSWNIVPSPSTPSVGLQMNNFLNDVSLNLEGSINLNEEGSSSFNALLKIARFYPDLTLMTTYGQRSTAVFQNNQVVNQQFNELDLSVQVAIPLRWLKGNFSTSLMPYVTLTQRNLTNFNIDNVASRPDNSFLSSNVGLTFSTVRRRAYQNVGPRLGFALQLASISTLNGDDNAKTVASSAVYLPGIGKNHAIQVRGAFQKELLRNSYQFSDTFVYPRGYNAPANDQVTSLAVNYGLPLFYPDAGLFGITYFKRVRANLFYDYAMTERLAAKTKTTYRSAGAELIFDNTFLNILPLSIGLRNSFLLDKDPVNPNQSFHFGIFVSTGL
ncbi:hypothetical protein [Runella limosa]|uniref:hypothetical protein n=1 Tax=Runella limosa TaxID=370978 RepID=UPI000402D564|nr:hypothetical protein [Runella limosa]